MPLQTLDLLTIPALNDLLLVYQKKYLELVKEGGSEDDLHRCRIAIEIIVKEIDSRK
jgi:hypothetical protein